jgi:intracellular proteinase inhibitor BsuPI
MNFRVAVFAGTLIAFAGCSNSSGVYRWVPFVGKSKKEQTGAALIKPRKSDPFGPITGPVYYGVEMRLKIVPEVIRLSETRALEVHLLLINRSRKPVNFIFNDSRKYDFILRDASGKKLAQWSDDQPVNQTPSYVIINPGERAEFVGNISTRDMSASRSYTLEAMVFGYDKMRLTLQVTPSSERIVPPVPGAVPRSKKPS